MQNEKKEIIEKKEQNFSSNSERNSVNKLKKIIDEQFKAINSIPLKKRDNILKMDNSGNLALKKQKSETESESEIESKTKSLFKLEEIKGDLFKSDYRYFVHCISKDLKLGAGIALSFRKNYPSLIKDLEKASPKIGDCFLHRDNLDLVFNLITKSVYRKKPSLEDFKKSLFSLRDLLVEHDIRELSMPRIGCGLDRLDWEVVKKMIFSIFGDLHLSIKVFFL